MVIGGPIEAGIGFGIGCALGTSSGLAVGAVGGKKVANIINNSIRRIRK
jgi:hypothetical protein